MARQIERLTQAGLRRLTKRGLYPDGAGLYLQVSASGAQSWIFRFKLGPRSRYMGLGSTTLVALPQARLLANACRQQVVLEGVDPIDARRRAAPVREAPLLFKDAAKAFVDAQAPGWRNAKHVDQWRNTLAAYVYPTIGSLPVDAIDTQHVLKVLEPIWFTKPETATRVRARMQSVLDWAGARGRRGGDNPARWDGHLDKLLPRKSKIRGVEHHPALPFAELPSLMAQLRARPGVTSTALQFLILTGARTGEALGARWSEIDSQQGIWTIPAARMKAHREHRVPLSEPALAILPTRPPGTSDGLIFTVTGGVKMLSNMALPMMLRRLGLGHLTVHGFRSTFRDWTAEQTDFSREVAEMALAHKVANKVEAAYRRGDLMEKRRELMGQWGAYCSNQPITPTEISRSDKANLIDRESAVNARP